VDSEPVVCVAVERLFGQVIQRSKRRREERGRRGNSLRRRCAGKSISGTPARRILGSSSGVWHLEPSLKNAAPGCDSFFFFCCN